MSWYVKELVINNHVFYSEILQIGEENINEDSAINLDSVFLEMDFNSDGYSDWLTISKTFEDLKNQNLVTKEEQEVYTNMSEGMALSQVAKKLEISQPTCNKIFNSIASKIAFILGEHFTDEGFISYMIEKYKLTQKQENKLRKIITKE